ncbi:hypothetical protein ONJ87_28300, partial [Salmonella enterica subsp. enterica serovar Anatum]|nr:hypothetical protein [Salmonella enterica subsp. enterica serovar Anatum]
VPLETGQIIAALLGDAPRNITLVVTEWRLPRVLMALLIGAALIGPTGSLFVGRTRYLCRHPARPVAPDLPAASSSRYSRY